MRSPPSPTKNRVTMEEEAELLAQRVRLLASSQLDAWPPRQRREIWQATTLELAQPHHSTHAAKILVEIGADLKCSSVHAYRRTCLLYAQVWSQHVAAHRDDHDDNGGGNHIALLANVLARLLQQSQLPSLVSTVALHVGGLRMVGNVWQDLARHHIAAPHLPVLVALGSRARSEAVAVAVAASSHDAWLDLLVQHIVTQFPSAANVAMARPLLQHMTTEQWEAVAPTLLLKLKSHPDKMLESLLGMVQHSAHVVWNDDWMPPLLKQLVSADARNRELASDILVAASAPATLPMICHQVANATPPTASARQAVYTTLQSLASVVGSSRSDDDDDDDDDVDVHAIVHALLTWLSKEPLASLATTTTTTTSSSSKAAGQAALVAWMIVAAPWVRRNRAGATTAAGYAAAQTYIVEVICGKQLTEAGHMLTLLLQSMPVDLLERVVTELWSPTLSAGLENLVEVASSKKTWQVEGLLSVYLALLYADASTSVAIPKWAIKVMMTTAPDGKTSFVFADAMLDALPSNVLAAGVLPRVVALYTKLASKREEALLPSLFASTTTTSLACKTLATCILYPASVVTQSPSVHQPTPAIVELLHSLDVTLTYAPSAARRLLVATLVAVNDAAVARETWARAQNATRDMRESETFIMGSRRQARAARAWSGVAVRRAAKLLTKYVRDGAAVACAAVALHVGTTMRPSSGAHRLVLTRDTLNLISNVIVQHEAPDDAIVELGSTVVDLATYDSCPGVLEQNASQRYSNALHVAASSAIISFGVVAGSFVPETDDGEDEATRPHALSHQLCVKEIAPRLGASLGVCLQSIEAFSDDDVMLYRSPMGSLVCNEKPASTAAAKPSSSKRLTDDELWEQETKREIAAKQKNGGSSSTVLTAEDIKMIAEQDGRRNTINSVVIRSFRAQEATEALFCSDIGVANRSILHVAWIVLDACVSTSPFLSIAGDLANKYFETLRSISTAVYEIDESAASAVARSLILSCEERKSDEVDELCIRSLPAAAEGAALVLREIDAYGDALSGPSFSLLLPIMRAIVTGPRTPTGCESVLELLSRQAAVLEPDSFDAIAASRRKDVAVSLLELLRHDRASTFRDPSAIETLIAWYAVDNEVPLSASELAPLLDTRGSLGPPPCRLASMRVLSHIAVVGLKSIKTDPLVENRIWVNCFDGDDAIRDAARDAWVRLKGEGSPEHEGLAPPSLVFSASLMPLLSHVDSKIASAAAQAFAFALRLRPDMLERSIDALANLYIESYPTVAEQDFGNPMANSIAPALQVTNPKKSISTGLPKKKAATQKSALAIAGIGKPKVAKKKTTASHAVFLKPKEERTLDQAELENQFKGGAVKARPEEDSGEKIAIRLGILRAVAALSQKMEPSRVALIAYRNLTLFLIAYGITDSDDTAQTAARNALKDTVAAFGGSSEAINFLLPILEEILKSGFFDETVLSGLPLTKLPRSVATSDKRKEGSVVALGSLAIHLEGSQNDSKINNTIDMLIAALKTPNEDVQSSVADALAKLMKKGRTQDRIESIVTDMMRECLYGQSLASRRGGAYGLTAAVKGSGIALLKKFDAVKQLEEACARGDANTKEGALFAVELLCSRLGLLFEPYVIVLLPALLRSFSDANDYVRNAAGHTAGQIMSKLSAHGVKLVMPAVLTAFDDPAWRTKQASIHMLGSMSHLAPRQLASALPKVVPKLIEAFADTHPKVKASAQEALTEICTVIKNPEVSSISSTLLKALTDPSEYTRVALEKLIETEFLHAIDSPSLALIAPILHRGLRDRGASSKRYGGLIAGNICTMINDPKDFVPYLPLLLPDLQSALLDPIPDVRSTAAKALGSLARSLGDHIVPELRPWLLKKMRDSTCSSAERSGAAQGLTEVLIASGSEVVDEAVRTDILPLRNFPEPSTREGVLWMLSFLPPAMGQGFTALIDASLPALINGLSDDSEMVRDVAMRAGRVLIKSHGKVHVDKILPSLEVGLADEDYRIRVSSLSLLGDLLSMIGGTQMIKGDGNTQDDIRRAERAQAQIALVLGNDTRRRVLSRLYLARNDSVHAVRSSAIQVWKTVVSVTARTLRDIMPVLVSMVIDDLASGHQERTEVAGRCLGDVCSKLGDAVLVQIIPVLRTALYDGDAHTKRGVCVGLSEVLQCSTKEQIVKYLDIITKVVQDALSDEDSGVRKMAAGSFQSLYNVVGSKAFDEVVPSLMVALESDEEERQHRALNGLTGILGVRSRELLPYLVPRLLQRPITSNHAGAINAISAVTAATIHFHFASIIPSLLGELADGFEASESGREVQVRGALTAICRNTTTVGVNSLVSEAVSKCGSDKASFRRESCRMIEAIVAERAKVGLNDFYDQIPIMLRELLYRMNDDDQTVLQAAHCALLALSNHVAAEELVKHVEFMRNLLASMVSDARRRKGGVGDGEFLLPGFNMPKGLDPLLPIYQRGILYGTPIVREVSATGLGEILDLTASKFLAGPVIVKITGPLLRIVGDRNPANVKSAILETLGRILVKGGAALRAFVPQFQTTFVKALADPSRQVRVEAIHALSLLMPLATRVDPLVKELVTGALGKAVSVEGTAAIAVQTATIEALAAVLKNGGEKVKLPASLPSALDASKELLMSSDDGIREAAAKVMGVVCNLLGPDATVQLIKTDVLANNAGSSVDKHGKACVIRRILEQDVGRELASIAAQLSATVRNMINDDKSLVREAACVAIGPVLGRSSDTKAAVRAAEAELIAIIRNGKEPMEIHRAISAGLCLMLQMIEPARRVDIAGVNLLDACLQLALTAPQRVQFAVNDVLWLALDVPSGTAGLDRYADAAMFDNVKSMKSLHSNVLTKIKQVTTVT